MHSCSFANISSYIFQQTELKQFKSEVYDALSRCILEIQGEQGTATTNSKCQSLSNFFPTTSCCLILTDVVGLFAVVIFDT